MGVDGPFEVDLRLVDVDVNNYASVMKLEIAQDQRGFVQSNSRALAEAAYVPGFWPRALYLDDDPVGLGLWAPNYPDYRYEGPSEGGVYIIDHVMIDRRYQGRGFGRRLVEMMLTEVRSKPDCRRVLIAAHAKNALAITVFKKTGFVESERVYQGDVMLELDSQYV